MSIPRFLCSCLLIANVCCTASAKDAPLVWKLRTGDEHHFQMTQDMDMETKIGDRNVENSVHQLMEMTWKIEQVDDQGLATLLQSVDRMHMTMQAPAQQEMGYDTDSKEAPSGFASMVAPLFKALTAEPFKMSITPRGEIKDFEMPESLTKAMKAMPGAAAMGEMFSEEGFKNMIQQSSLILPEAEDLKPGHEWTTETQMKNALFGTLDIKATYGYLGPREVKGKPYEVFSVTMEMDFGASPGGVQLEIISHESSGEIFFNRDAGRLESSKLQQVIEMNIEAANQKMKQKMTQTVVLERVEKEQVEKEQTEPNS